MNVLVTSVGRRVKIIEYLKDSLKNIGGKVISTDCDKNAPGLYFSDEYEIVPRISDPNYIDIILEICKKYNIKGVISLIDPELELLAEHENLFNQKDIKLILSSKEEILIAFDKFKTYEYLSANGISCVPTYNNLSEVINHLKAKKISYPLVVKPATGSASIGIKIVNDENELIRTHQENDGLIIQPYYKDKEYGIDVYIDLNSGELVDMFMKEKLLMRSGETDKSVSIYIEEIETLIKKLTQHMKLSGPIDVDCFQYEGKFYISEINPRFGGGYPHAYEMDCNFMDYIVNNLLGKTNPVYKSYQYEQNVVMMKYDNVKLINKH